MIDSHCHFDFDDFALDRSEVWQRCCQLGLKGMVIPGVSIAQWRTLFELLQRRPEWHGAVGVHPWWVKELATDHPGPGEELQEWLLGQLLHWGRNSRCVAIGECGLDRAIDTPLALQRDIFRVHLRAACELQLPLIIHVHRYHADVLALLKEYRPLRGGVIHAFSGSEEIAREYWKLGFYLGIGGTITYPRAAKTRRAVAAVPLEALLLESDAPDMPLSGRQGQRNSPEFLPDIAAELASLRAVPVEEVAVQALRNTRQLFSL
nr:TatD family hydrolase [Microbulbifer zhoushanensis]